jgi:poly-gamma-glutamate synthesis protein (capsule biosynthesis protein)
VGLTARVRAVAGLVAVLALLVTAAPASASGSVRLMAVGDVNLAQATGRRIVRNGPMTPWRNVVGFFDQADVVLANLECTISKRGTPWNKDFTFRAPPAAADSLVAGGIDVVNLANNHALDFGQLAFADTLAALDVRGIGHVGGGANSAAAHAPLIIERNGLRIAILGYSVAFAPEAGFRMGMWAAGPNTPGLAVATPDVVAGEVAAIRPTVDAVVVTVHGGREYSTRPNAKMRDFVSAALGAGATLVVGHHPHVLQGYRHGPGTLVAYSLGNFVFNYFTGAPNDTAILDVTLTAAGVQSVNWIPVVVQNGVPRPARGDEITRILHRLPQLP